jgi:hypothetical protein
MTKMPYQSVDQLIKDEGFLAWYFGTDPVQVSRWTRWIIASNENAELARQAYDELQSIQRAEGNDLPEEEFASLWAAIEAGIRKDDRNIPPPTAKPT